MKKLLLILACMASLTLSARNSAAKLLDEGWKFSLTADSSVIAPGYDDAQWRAVNLPHDWSVEFDFDRNNPSGNDGGYLPTGLGWYLTQIDVPADNLRRSLYIEGAYMNSQVYVNGQLAGGHPYGYTSYRVDITPYLQPGANTIAIKVDNSRQKNSRWYTGSGLYRNVWLEENAPVFINPASLYITTPIIGAERAVAQVKFTFDSSKTAERKDVEAIPLKMYVSTPHGAVIATITDTVKVQPGESFKPVCKDFTVANPELWSLDSPNLYTLDIEFENDGVTESVSENFGFRTIDWSVDRGFVLNGEPIKISGACIHHDNGILGAASYDDAEYRKAQLLKSAGFNAVRTSHNPPAPAFLDACDRLGLLVIDEAFDGWKAEKNAHDYHELFDEWAPVDVAMMVQRDRNHPSIIAWSIGNEIIERKSPEAVERARKLAAVCRANDPTRPVTQALAAWDPDWEIYDPLAAEHDIVGYNYLIHKAEGDHQRVPSRIMWQTESYPRDAFQNWEKVNDLPYVIGDFVWTGIDYIGESGIGRHYYQGDPEGEHYHRPLWPWHNSECGDIDIIGQRKPISYYRQMLYSPKPMMHMAVREPNGYRGEIKETLWGRYPTYDSWNWKGWEGKPIEVEIASTYPEVELIQDGVSLGRKPTTRAEQFKATWQVKYKPGKLQAIAYDADGKVCEIAELATSGKAAAIRLTAEKGIADSEQHLTFVTAEVVDRNGNLVPDATNELMFSVSGDGELLAMGNDDATDPRGYSHPNRKAHHGRAMAVVKTNGKATLTVTAKGLKKSTIQVL